MKVWWLCPKTNCKEGCPHSYSTSLSDRGGTRTYACPFCSVTPKRVCQHNSLAIKSPDVMKFWHFEKNKGLDPKTLSCFSNRRVWWQCPNVCQFGCLHEWQTTVSSLSSGSRCPFCCITPQQVCQHNSLAYIRPDLMVEWDDRNTLNPCALSVSSNYKANWMCKVCDSRWQAVIHSRTRSGSGSRGCPKCRQSKMERDMGYVLDSLSRVSQPKWNMIRVRQNDRNTIKGQEVDKLIELQIQSISHEVVIEMDGMQHFQSVKFFGGDVGLQLTQQRDARKNKACQDKLIHLLRIGCDVTVNLYSDIVKSFLDRIAECPNEWHLQCVGMFYNGQCGLDECRQVDTAVNECE